jgi:hypothetical protein
MTENFVWNPVGTRLATPEEFEQRVKHRLQAPRTMPTGKQPERGSVCLVTTSNGKVDLDEYGILSGIDDWFFYDCGCVVAWTTFPLFDETKGESAFWHEVKNGLPSKEGAFLVALSDGKYEVEMFNAQSQAFAQFENVVAWAELPAPYKP